MAANGISDRHLREAEGLRPSAQAASVALKITISRGWIDTPVGQLMLSCLVNLLCRQTDLVRSIDLDGLETKPVIVLPHENSPPDFLGSLARLASWATGDAVRVTVGAGLPADLRLVIGTDDLVASDTPTLFGI